MKQLIVYYSLEGNTDYIARTLAKNSHADVLCLKPVKPFPTKSPMKYIKGGMSAVFGRHPKLEPYTFDKDAYDCIILGCPVWAGRMASPMASFLKNEHLNGLKVKLFLCHADEKDEKAMERFEKALEGNTVVKKLTFVEPLSRQGELSTKSIREFLRAE